MAPRVSRARWPSSLLMAGPVLMAGLEAAIELPTVETVAAAPTETVELAAGAGAGIDAAAPTDPTGMVKMKSNRNRIATPRGFRPCTPEDRRRAGLTPEPFEERGAPHLHRSIRPPRSLARSQRDSTRSRRRRGDSPCSREAGAGRISPWHGCPVECVPPPSPVPSVPRTTLKSSGPRQSQRSLPLVSIPYPDTFASNLTKSAGPRSPVKFRPVATRDGRSRSP